jgi:hypothetical protein
VQALTAADPLVQLVKEIEFALLNEERARAAGD